MGNVIWQEDSDYYKLEPLTDEMVKKAEEKLKIKLPQSYINILKDQNGGYIKFNSYPTDVPTSWADDHINVDYILGISLEDGILKSEYFIEEWEMPQGLVLFNGDGHTWIAFDYRHVSSEPPIVYIDNEDEKIIKIANHFDEFLEGLYTEESEPFDEVELQMKEYSKEEFETLIQQDNVEEISSAIMYLSQCESDVDWLSKQLMKLSNHPDDDLRNEIANSVWNNLTYQIDNETIQEFIEVFKKDTDIGVQQYAEMIIEKLSYSYEDLKRDLGFDQPVSFSFQDHIYHINEHSNQWHLSDYEFDLQSFSTTEELIQLATLDGKSLEEIWVNAKIL
jgi:hypothetical protein